eukprot:gnl/MRDRNA2_/MRDRNA2_30320_c0_seq1.p1 gnl/MRDRNA2_/MRDRNA2_30320_c0~~gnl/MRDRNA2_/MRDRNA2_30320_c0_seq1.p1  ORF type:complete len:747 (+),score=203.50 gnl/MRDRNA2_/MRDRNA2_30320_c0_seq1:193-2433(+)
MPLDLSVDVDIVKKFPELDPLTNDDLVLLWKHEHRVELTFQDFHDLIKSAHHKEHPDDPEELSAAFAAWVYKGIMHGTKHHPVSKAYFFDNFNIYWTKREQLLAQWERNAKDGKKKHRESHEEMQRLQGKHDEVNAQMVSLNDDPKEIESLKDQLEKLKAEMEAQKRRAEHDEARYAQSLQAEHMKLESQLDALQKEHGQVGQLEDRQKRFEAEIKELRDMSARAEESAKEMNLQQARIEIATQKRAAQEAERLQGENEKLEVEMARRKQDHGQLARLQAELEAQRLEMENLRRQHHVMLVPIKHHDSKMPSDDRLIRLESELREARIEALTAQLKNEAVSALNRTEAHALNQAELEASATAHANRFLEEEAPQRGLQCAEVGALMATMRVEDACLAQLEQLQRTEVALERSNQQLRHLETEVAMSDLAGWCCPQCRYLNLEGVVHCQMCGFQGPDRTRLHVGMCEGTQEINSLGSSQVQVRQLASEQWNLQQLSPVGSPMSIPSPPRRIHFQKGQCQCAELLSDVGRIIAAIVEIGDDALDYCEGKSSPSQSIEATRIRVFHSVAPVLHAGFYVDQDEDAKLCAVRKDVWDFLQQCSNTIKHFPIAPSQQSDAKREHLHQQDYFYDRDITSSHTAFSTGNKPQSMAQRHGTGPRDVNDPFEWWKDGEDTYREYCDTHKTKRNHQGAADVQTLREWHEQFGAVHAALDVWDDSELSRLKSARAAMETTLNVLDTKVKSPDEDKGFI